MAYDLKGKIKGPKIISFIDGSTLSVEIKDVVVDVGNNINALVTTDDVVINWSSVAALTPIRRTSENL